MRTRAVLLVVTALVCSLPAGSPPKASAVKTGPAALVSWDADLRAATMSVAQLVIAGLGPAPDGEPSSVREMYDRNVDFHRHLARRLDRIEEEVEVLADVAAWAAADGWPTGRFDAVVAAASEWLAAQREAADPHLCRHLLPEGAGAWAVTELAVFDPYRGCYRETAAPLAHRLAESATALEEAFSLALSQ